MSKELITRIITSFFLLTSVILMFFYSYILIIGLMLITIILWIEFCGLISKIFSKNNFKNKFLKYFSKIFSLLYFTFFASLIFSIKSGLYDLELFLIYCFLISICTDIGGLVFGKIFKGKKLTKISPNKTISGSIGSFISSILLVPFFFNHLDNLNIYLIVIVTLLISLTSQIGDLYISYLKRIARVKDTSDLLPGHGGFLDRLDGILLAVPIGLLIFINL